jgi:hypothetical protein
MFDESKATGLLWEIYDRRKAQIRVSAAWLATEAMRELDPMDFTLDSIYVMAHSHLKQLARQILRKRFEPEDDTMSAQSELFPDLQQRYPVAHERDTEPEYVLLEYMNDRDVTFNVNRLRSEARAKLRHADALEAWWQNKKGGGGIESYGVQ